MELGSVTIAVIGLIFMGCSGSTRLDSLITSATVLRVMGWSGLTK